MDVDNGPSDRRAGSCTTHPTAIDGDQGRPAAMNAQLAIDIVVMGAGRTPPLMGEGGRRLRAEFKSPRRRVELNGPNERSNN